MLEFKYHKNEIVLFGNSQGKIVGFRRNVDPKGEKPPFRLTARLLNTMWLDYQIELENGEKVMVKESEIKGYATEHHN